MTTPAPLTRRSLLVRLALTSAAIPAFAGCRPAAKGATRVSSALGTELADVERWRALTEADWRERLDDSAFRVLRLEATEPPRSSPLDKETRSGTYHCAGCELPLFSSEHKYDSGTGWPSFWAPISDTALGTKPDNTLWYTRTEYHCARCLGHQGHVFDDGPRPTGLRYCNNGIALSFRPA